MPTAWLTSTVDREAPAELARRGHTALHPWEPVVTPELVARCHDVGILVNAWTCNAPTRFLDLVAAGVDGVCTDIPDVMLAALATTP